MKMQISNLNPIRELEKIKDIPYSTDTFESKEQIDEIKHRATKTRRSHTITKLFEKFSSRRMTKEEPLPPPKRSNLEPANTIATKLSITTSNPNKYLVDYIDTRDPRTQFGPLTKIGSGSTGDVFRAIHIPTKQKCAIKIVKINAETKLEMIENEIRMLASIRHKNFCKYINTYATVMRIFVTVY